MYSLICHLNINIELHIEHNIMAQFKLSFKLSRGIFWESKVLFLSEVLKLSTDEKVQWSEKNHFQQ